MTLYNFTTYSGDEYLLLSDTDNMTVEEVFRNYIPDEFYCWKEVNKPFSYMRFSSRKINSGSEFINLFTLGKIDINKMENDVPYFSDSFNMISYYGSR